MLNRASGNEQSNLSTIAILGSDESGRSEEGCFWLGENSYVIADPGEVN